MRMIKVGDQYLGLVNDQKDALRLDVESSARTVAIMVPGARTVKLKTRTIDPPAQD